MNISKALVTAVTAGFLGIFAIGSAQAIQPLPSTGVVADSFIVKVDHHDEERKCYDWKHDSYGQKYCYKWKYKYCYKWKHDGYGNKHCYKWKWGHKTHGGHGGYGHKGYGHKGYGGHGGGSY